MTPTPYNSGSNSSSLLSSESFKLSVAKLLDTVRAPAQYDWEKLHQYLEVRMNDLYFRGKQYLAMSPFGQFVDLKPSNDPAYLAFTSKEAQDASPFLYDYILPIFRGDVLKLASVVGTRAPNLKATPFIQGKPLQSRTARTANKVLAYLRSHFNLDEFSRNLSLGLLKSGTQFGYVNWNVSRELYGTGQVQGPPQIVQVPEHEPYYQCYRCGETATEAERMEFGGRCKRCEAELGEENLVTAETSVGVEQPGEMMETVNGAVELTLTSVLTTDVPFHVKDMESAPWLKYEFDAYKWALIRKYKGEAPELVGKMNEAPYGATTTEQWAADIRQAQMNPSGTRAYSRDPNLWLSTELWITPEMYEAVPVDQSGNTRQILEEEYPEGVRVCYVNSRPVALYSEKLARHWTSCKPNLSESLFGDPVFSDYRQGVDVLNDSLNMIIEALEHTTGEVVYDSQALSREYLENNAARAGVWLPANFQGRSSGDLFYRVPGSEIKEGIIQFVEWYIKQLRESVGITPALFGASQAQTAREAEINRNQALQQHLLMYNNMREFLARTMENSIYVLSTHSKGELYYRSRVPGKAQMERVQDLSILQQGGYKVWAEEAFPMTPGQRRDWIGDVLQNPQSYPIVSLVKDPNFPPLVPQNLGRIHESLSLDDWYIEGLDAYNRMLEIIDELLGGEVVQQVDQMTGQPVAMPSMQPDTLLFEPGFAIQVLRGWLHTEDAREAEEIQPGGFENVRAYLEAWMQVEQQQQMQEQMQMMGQPGQQGGDMGMAQGGGGDMGMGEQPDMPGGQSTLPPSLPPGDGVPELPIAPEPLPTQSPLQ
jgi:hypothetical protein